MANNAPSYTVRNRKIVSLEHPCIIKNISNAIETLGGEDKVERLVNTQNENYSHPLCLRPGDPLCKPITSKFVKTNNVLLKIDVPKRTGRKRKRGSLEPYSNGDATNGKIRTDSADGETSGSIDPLSRQGDYRYLLKSLRDNQDSYHVEAVGRIDHSHRYRGLSDFQHSTSQGQFIKRMKDTFLTFDLEQIKKFKLDPSKGVKPNTELFPPPAMSNLPLPFNYSYLQNPAVRYTVDASGQSILANSQLPQKLFTQMMTHDSPEVPTAPSPELPPLEVLDPKLKSTVLNLQSLFDQRPLWTRRALSNQLGHTEPILKFAYQYVGFMFRSGPWREAVVRYGVDPRSDPKFRVYQTLMFQVSTKENEADEKQWVEERVKYARTNRGKKSSTTSHIFDGRSVSLDGKVWQVCDITDPLLQGLLAADELRPTCETRSDGWFLSSTWSKVKTIMKDKMRKLLANQIPSDFDYQDVLDSGGGPDVGLPTSRLRRREIQSRNHHSNFRAETRQRLRKRRKGRGLTREVLDERVSEAMRELEEIPREPDEDDPEKIPKLDGSEDENDSEDDENDDLDDDDELDEDDEVEGEADSDDIDDVEEADEEGAGVVTLPPIKYDAAVVREADDDDDDNHDDDDDDDEEEDQGTG
ncbi:MAG: tau 95 subunit of transcription factor TFIIIC [Sclerophora amabilis]|nr:MAG: tau 95 subunit of transcription factor TFIIIC [Sclerophora amabilis]